MICVKCLSRHGDGEECERAKRNAIRFIKETPEQHAEMYRKLARKSIKPRKQKRKGKQK